APRRRRRPAPRRARRRRARAGHRRRRRSRSDLAEKLLEKTVRVSSPTGDLRGVRKVGAIFDGEFRRLGFSTRWVSLPRDMNRAGHLVAERRGTRGKRVLLIGHLDTVLPGGRWTREGTVGRG